MALTTALIHVMTGAALKAGRALARDFGEIQSLQASPKGTADFARAARTKAERVIRDELARARPGVAIDTEADAAVHGPRWLFTALDGMQNFQHGLPFFATTIAFEQAGEVVAGVTHDHIRDETFWAEKGRGAWLDRRRIRVSGHRDLGDALVAAAHLGVHADPAGETGRAFATLEGTRVTGAPALDLAYVAAGRFDAACHAGVPPSAMAAGIVLVREAGGYVTDLRGSRPTPEKGGIVAANDAVHRALMRLIAAA